MDPGILVPLTLFGGAAVVLWTVFEGRHKERMAMIEKGINPAEFKQVTPHRIWQGNVLSNLKWGLLFVFTGVGLLVGQQLEYYFRFDEGAAVFGCTLVAGGLALIFFYFIASKKLKNQPPDEQ